MASMVAGRVSMTENEWSELRSNAAEAALTLMLEAAGEDVHADYRPTVAEIGPARTAMARWMAVAGVPLSAHSWSHP